MLDKNDMKMLREMMEATVKETVEAAHNNHVNTVQTSYLIEHVANLENRMQAVEKNMEL